MFMKRVAQPNLPPKVAAVAAAVAAVAAVAPVGDLAATVMEDTVSGVKICSFQFFSQSHFFVFPFFPHVCALPEQVRQQQLTSQLF